MNNRTTTSATPILYTRHYEDRINGRMADFVSADQVKKAVESRSFYKTHGQTYVKVTTLPRVIRFDDGPNTIVGDTVYAVVDRTDINDTPRVVTVLLRSSRQTVRDFQPHYMVKQHARF